jgi:hypothetical protein
VTPDVIVGHGFTVADAERIAGRAASEHPSDLLSREERRDAGFHAIVEALLSSPAQVPNLLRVASDAISRAVTDEKHHRGLSSREAGTAPRFARFWYQPHLPFEDELIDALAVRQVLAGIRPSWRRDLEALAGHDSYAAAAQALATTPVTFRSRISKARAAAGELWFAPDMAPGMWGSDRRGGTTRPRPVTRCVRTRTRDRQAVAEAA